MPAIDELITFIEERKKEAIKNYIDAGNEDEQDHWATENMVYSIVLKRAIESRELEFKNIVEVKP